MNCDFYYKLKINNTFFLFVLIDGYKYNIPICYIEKIE